MNKSLSLIQKFERNKFLKMSYYAVAKGRNTGIYSTWEECKAQVDKYPGATFKKFGSESGAANFISERSGGGGGSSYSAPSRNHGYSNYSSSSRSSYNNYSKPSSSGYSGGSSSFSSGQSSLERYFTPVPNETREYSTSSRNNYDKKFNYDSNGRVDIYTDGACSSNGYKNAKAGIGVYFDDDHSENVSKPVRGRPTNNNAEIQAVTEAARIAKKNGLKKIRINTDSKFVIDCKTKWMSGWKRRGWKTSAGHHVVNREELEEMEHELRDLDVEFNHVKGHSEVHGNNMADSLARRGAEYYE